MEGVRYVLEASWKPLSSFDCRLRLADHFSNDDEGIPSFDIPEHFRSHACETEIPARTISVHLRFLPIGIPEPSRLVFIVCGFFFLGSQEHVIIHTGAYRQKLVCRSN